MRRFVLLVSGLALVAGIAATVSGGATRAEARWVITDLGWKGWAVGINGRGQVIGNDGTHAFLWEQGKVRDLGTLGGESSTAVAINERGQIVGNRWFRMKDKYGTEIVHAFLWENGKMRDLGTLGREWSRAVAINDRGQIIGSTSGLSGERPRAFIWANGKMRDLGSLGTKTPVTVMAINNRGQVIGNEGWSAEERAFLWEKGKLRDLGTLGGSHSNVYAINDHSQIVGRSTLANREWWRATLWENDRIRNLGTDGWAVAINDQGQIIGSTWPGAFFWQRGKISYIGGSGSKTEAVALNDRGEVVGYRWSTDCGEMAGMRDEPIPRAFVWVNGKMTVLPTLRGGDASLPGPPAYEHFFPSPSGVINDRGQIVGWSTTSQGDYCNSPVHAVLWTLKRG